MITDIHTHAFPDAIAERAMRILCEETNDVVPALDGRLSSLLASMDRNGIGRSVMCSVATRPEQFESILEWSKQIASERIVPFPSFHPADADSLDKVARIAECGFKGVKLHPYYQEFDMDEERMWPLYERMRDLNLLLVCHTGYDIGFPRYRRADPERIQAVTRRIPDLKLITAHLGSWEDWDGVEARLIGRPVYMEVSFALSSLPQQRARSMLLEHPSEYLLFGTDSPWQDQGKTLAWLRSLNLGADREEAMLVSNAERLLDSAG